MAEVVATGQDTTHPRRIAGTKRAADNGLESEQRLSKRFDLLNLENGTRLYLPVASSSDPTLSSPPSSTHQPTPKPLPASPSPQPSRRRPRPRRPPSQDDSMHVEDTPYRVYISDLDAELSDIESDEDNPIFLADIEKHIAKIPQHVLRGPDPRPTKDNQLVLYNVPSSLSVPEAQDSVRKAIAEARERLRRGSEGLDMGRVEVPSTSSGLGAAAREIPQPSSSFDDDAMELD